MPPILNRRFTLLLLTLSVIGFLAILNLKFKTSWNDSEWRDWAARKAEAGLSKVGLGLKEAKWELPYLEPLNPKVDSDSDQDGEYDTWSIPAPEEVVEVLSPRIGRLLSTPVQSYSTALEANERVCGGLEIQSNQDQIRGEKENWEKLESKQLAQKRVELVQAIQKGFALEGAGGKRQVREEEENQESSPITRRDLLSGTGRRRQRTTTTESDDLPLSKRVPVEATSTSLSPKQWKALFGDGRGIVMTAGNADTFTRLLTVIRILRRRYDCTLPIEVFGFREELSSAKSNGWLSKVREFGDVNFREITKSKKDSGQWKNFQVKGESILASSFAEVLYLDSDNVPLRDPSFLFNTPLYRENGVVFWPDLTKDGPANPIWRIAGRSCIPEHYQIDSGQILFNKRAQSGLNLAALFVTVQMQIDWQWWFSFTGGDKDTFRYAFYIVQAEYTPAPHYLSEAGTLVDLESGHRFCGHSMFHYGLSLNEWDSIASQLSPSYSIPTWHTPPLFVHANLLKHSQGYLNRQGTTFKHVKRLNGRDTATKDNLDRMKKVRSKVWNSRMRGMCADLWMEGLAKGQDGAGLETERGTVTEEWDQAWGGMLKGFENMWYAEGGRSGGF